MRCFATQKGTIEAIQKLSWTKTRSKVTYKDTRLSEVTITGVNSVVSGKIRYRI